jgi:hypothetical protein
MICYDECICIRYITVMSLLCGLCLENEDKCKHWTIEKGTEEIISFVDETETVGYTKKFMRKPVPITKVVKKEVTQNIVKISVICFCGKTIIKFDRSAIDRYNSGEDLMVTCKCKSRMLYGKYTKISSLSKFSEYIKCKLTDTCKDCTMTGKIEKKQFMKCSGCEGFGGIKCMVCIKNNYKKEYGGEFEDHKCEYGFAEVCSICLGACSIGLVVESNECSKCISKEKWAKQNEEIADQILISVGKKLPKSVEPLVDSIKLSPSISSRSTVLPEDILLSDCVEI